MLPVKHEGCLYKDDGQVVRKVESAVYLGGLLTSDGNPACELSRRMGEAGAAFDLLARVWKHANLARSRKPEIYKACVIPKLLYGLETVWLRSAEQKRLTGFHCKCLRKILGIPHSYISHVTNASVLQQAGEKPLYRLLLTRQLLFYGRIAKLPEDDLRRQAVMKPGEVEPAKWEGRRSKGRPRQAWASNV